MVALDFSAIPIDLDYRTETIFAPSACAGRRLVKIEDPDLDPAVDAKAEPPCKRAKLKFPRKPLGKDFFVILSGAKNLSSISVVSKKTTRRFFASLRMTAFVFLCSPRSLCYCAESRKQTIKNMDNVMILTVRQRLAIIATLIAGMAFFPAAQAQGQAVPQAN